MGPPEEVTTESLATSASYTESSWANLVGDCYSHAQSVITGTEAIQTCNSQVAAQDIYEPACGMAECLVSGGVAYEIATYNGSAPSLTGLTEASPVPAQVPSGESLSGLCAVTANYLGFDGAVETATSYGFISVAGTSDAGLESECNTMIKAQLAWEQDGAIPSQGGSNYNPLETLTDLNTGTVLENNVPFVPTGDTLTGLCSWYITGTYDNWWTEGKETLWATSDQALESSCEAYIFDAMSNVSSGEDSFEYPTSYSLVDQTTGATLISVNCPNASAAGCK